MFNTTHQDKIGPSRNSLRAATTFLRNERRGVTERQTFYSSLLQRPIREGRPTLDRTVGVVMSGSLRGRPRPDVFLLRGRPALLRDLTLGFGLVVGVVSTVTSGAVVCLGPRRLRRICRHVVFQIPERQKRLIMLATRSRCCRFARAIRVIHNDGDALDICQCLVVLSTHRFEGAGR